MKRVRTSSSCGRDVTVQSTSSSLLQRLPHECIDHVRTYLCLGCLAHMALASSHLHGASIAYLRLAVCVETCAIQCCASRIQPSTNIGLGVRLLERYARQLEQLIIRASYRQTGRASDTAVYWDAIARVIAHCSATLRVVSVHIYTDAIFAALAQCSNLRTLPFIDLPNSAVSLSSDLLLRVIRNSRSLTTASLSSNMGYNLKVYQALLQSESPLEDIALYDVPLSVLPLLTRHAATLDKLWLREVTSENARICAELAVVLPTLTRLTTLNVTVLNESPRLPNVRSDATEYTWKLPPSVRFLTVDVSEVFEITNTLPHVMQAPGLVTFSGYGVSVEQIAQLLVYAPLLRTCTSLHTIRSGERNNRAFERAIDGGGGSALTDVTIHGRYMGAATLAAISRTWRALQSLDILVHSRVPPPRLIAFLHVLPPSIAFLNLAARVRPRAELMSFLQHGRSDIREHVADVHVSTVTTHEVAVVTATTMTMTPTPTPTSETSEHAHLLPQLLTMCVAMDVQAIVDANLVCPLLYDLSCRDGCSDVGGGGGSGGGGDIALLLRRYPTLSRLCIRASSLRDTAATKVRCTVRDFEHEAPLSKLKTLRLVAFDGCLRTLLSWCPLLETIELIYVRPHVVLELAMCDDCTPLLATVGICGNLDLAYPLVCTYRTIRPVFDAFPCLVRLEFNMLGPNKSDDFVAPNSYWRHELSASARDQLRIQLRSRLSKPNSANVVPELYITNRVIGN